jgi:hypothetical protein
MGAFFIPPPVHPLQMMGYTKEQTYPTTIL